MRRFQRGTGEEARFWNVEVVGSAVELSFGKAGTSGRRQRVECATAEAAWAAAEHRAEQKLREGYTELLTGSPLQQALEGAIVAQPDDLAAHMAYADWLGEQADPLLQARGEFIRVQLALEDPTRSTEDRRRLETQETELLERHRDTWLRSLAPLFPPEGEPHSFVRFARGWINALQLDRFDEERARRLARAPQLRLLRQLTLFDDVDFDSALTELAEARHLGNVEVLTLGDIDGERGFRTFNDAMDLAEVLPSFPRLRELNLNARYVLEGDLFESPIVRQLHTLRLERVHLYDDGVRRLARSGVVDSLRVLQLWNARFGDEGARALARHKALRRLELLDVSFNYLTPAGIEALRRTGVRLVAEYQMSPMDDYQDEDDFDLDEFDDEWE